MRVTDFSYTSGQVMKLADVSKENLKYWTQTKIAAPSVEQGIGTGNRKRWSFTDVLGLRVIARLRQQEVPLQRVRAILPNLRKWTKQPDNLAALASCRLVVLDKDVAIVENNKELISVLDGQHLIAPVVMKLRDALVDVENNMVKLAKSDQVMAASVTALKENNLWELDVA